ncbi:MAG TPA: serine/threonine-protein kinase [Thermoanaerobaculia bacterium]|jgi:serine/threonine protein kinase|nr:serine/threonine-protein kinase [Thermoanaerobaculia bacterium]
MSEASAPPSVPGGDRRTHGGSGPAARGALRPGDRLAERFRVIELLGSGATGEVYEAEDSALGERVALKLLRPDLAADEGLLLRFKRELHLARQVTHPNVCRLYDLVLAAAPRVRRTGDSADLVLVSMERLAGESLGERLERCGPMAPEEALDVVRQAAAGLDAAHRARVVHRDFKPGNVMLVPEEGGVRAVVTDFGLARVDLSGDPGGSSSGAEATTLTQDGSILGSPAYMAPEQVRGEVATAASDLYAFGVVLYEMVTGHLPFEGGGAFQTALRRLHEEPKPPSAWVPGLDPRWERAILACLAREPGDRPASAAAVVRSLEGEEILQHRAPSAPSSPSPRGPSRFGVRRALLVGLLGVLGLAVGAWLAFRPSGSARTAEANRLLSEGLAELRRFNAAAARQVLERAAQEDPQNARIPWALASALSLLGHEREAREAARRAFEMSSDLPDPDRWEIEARYRGLADDEAAEIALYQRLYRAFPGNLEYGLGLANAQVAGEQTEGAVATLIGLRRLPTPAGDDPRIEVLAAKAASATGDLQGQLAYATRAVERGKALGCAPLLVARAQFFEANALRMLGRLGPALAAAQASRAGYAAGGNPAGEALAWKEIGALSTLRGDLPGALAAFDRTVDLAGQAGWQAGVSYGLNGRAIVLRREGRFAEAAETFEQLLELQREMSDARGEAASRNNQAMVLLELGRLDEAEGALDRARRLYVRMGDRGGEATVLLGRCGLLDRRNQLAAAGQACRSAKKLFAEVKDEGGMIDADLTLARLDRRAGRFDAARAGLQEGARRAEALGDADLQETARRELAELARDEGKAGARRLRSASPP